MHNYTTIYIFTYLFEVIKKQLLRARCTTASLRWLIVYHHIINNKKRGEKYNSNNTWFNCSSLMLIGLSLIFVQISFFYGFSRSDLGFFKIHFIQDIYGASVLLISEILNTAPVQIFNYQIPCICLKKHLKMHASSFSYYLHCSSIDRD